MARIIPESFRCLQMQVESFHDYTKGRLAYEHPARIEGVYSEFVGMKDDLDKKVQVISQKIEEKEASDLKKLLSKYLDRALIAINSREYKFHNDPESEKILRKHVDADRIALEKMSKEIVAYLS